MSDCGEHVNEAVEQAQIELERELQVEAEQSDQIASLQAEVESLKHELEAAREKIAGLRGALEDFADPNNWYLERYANDIVDYIWEGAGDPHQRAQNALK